MPPPEGLSRYFAGAIERCAESFGELDDAEWRRPASKTWTARDYLAHLVSSHQREGEVLTGQALRGEPAHLQGFSGREGIDEYNYSLLEDVRELEPSALLDRFREGYRSYRSLLNSLSEGDLARPASNPGWSRAGTIGDLFIMTYLHLPAHYQDIRRAARNLPHWADLAGEDELRFQLDCTFRFMPLLLWPDRAGDLRAIFLFGIEGKGGGRWAIEVAGGRAEPAEVSAGRPSIELRMNARSWMDLTTGDINPLLALLARRIKLSGNPLLALKLEHLFQVT